ncbi:MAG: hypothetical protein GF383_15130 [Candidatus Lokiarchaeota archaeon]|nr:hypothetical protein [Candidatus Lokiarchaeota archaeon]MBD3342849.1 hypothetical protein [Candidatus Lokiarchaeota archaeon]
MASAASARICIGLILAVVGFLFGFWFLIIIGGIMFLTGLCTLGKTSKVSKTSTASSSLPNQPIGESTELSKSAGTESLSTTQPNVSKQAVEPVNGMAKKVPSELSESSLPQFCPHCGARTTSAYCPDCGSKLD